MVSNLKPVAEPSRLAARFRAVRNATEGLLAPLNPEDTVVQSMADVSPTKWHLAHVTWFFEQFVLLPASSGYERYDESYDFLFNSYYYSVGQMHARTRRGMLTRPTLAEVLSYRHYVDTAVDALLETDSANPEIEQRIELGIQHEQQHQELLLADIKHVLAQNPLKPAYDPELRPPPRSEAPALRFEARAAGIRRIGHAGKGFAFDNETPRHDTLLMPHRIANRPVTNAEYREFIDAGGYRDTALWLADGWATVVAEHWRRPLYWSEDLDREFTLGGLRSLDPGAPVSHLSFYEADAFARWAGARLPTEFEWEAEAAGHKVSGNLAERGYLHPASGAPGQYFGDVWEWTSSSYAGYPGFRPPDGPLGEYNGKFMCSQMSVRGGSALTAESHIRASYRSFFYPQQRWQMLGLRLAQDGGRA